MSRECFESLLGLHGAPTFAGEKPAVLLSFRKSQFDDFDAMLASFLPCFHCKGISVLRLVEGEEASIARAFPCSASWKGRSMCSCCFIGRGASPAA